jgi:hypothetical protein
VTSLENCDIKLSTAKSYFIHDFISTLDDVAELKNRVMKPPLRMG